MWVTTGRPAHNASDSRIDLVGIVEAAKHSPFLPQIVIGPIGRSIVDCRDVIITRHKAAGQANDLLVEEMAVLIWQHDWIGNDVVEELPAPQRSREAKILDDDRSRTGRKQRQPGIVRMACRSIRTSICVSSIDFAVELVLAIDKAIK
jgi:hypothetical protein